MTQGLRSRITANSTKEPQNGAVATGVEKAHPPEKTDYSLWRLKVLHGQQIWHYLTPSEAQKWPQSIADKYLLGLPTGLPNLPPPKTIREAARNGFAFYSALQTEDGHWACEYGGPMFLLPGLVIAMYITETPIPDEWRVEII